jgi:hypothetical protein
MEICYSHAEYIRWDTAISDAFPGAGAKQAEKPESQERCCQQLPGHGRRRVNG